jgi:hypothetical protein
MHAYLSTTQHADNIRKTLKAQHGWTSRDVSVRADRYSMGSSIYVTIRRADIPLAIVEGIAKQAESISRCAITGDILSGGNRYVSVRYDRAATDAIAAKVRPNVEAAVAAVGTVETSALERIAGTRFSVGRTMHTFTLWSGSFIQQCTNVDELARTVGALMAQNGEVLS